jgi:NADPH:quinone reductase-like Zn-dependent oxidoreductase
MLLAWWISKTGSNKMTSFLARIKQEDLTVMQGLLESGKVKPVIDRRYSLKDAAEALRYLGQGHARGKVVITMEQAVTT